MQGFAYEVPDDLRGPGFSTRTYESVRRNRPNVIDCIRQVDLTNLIYRNGEKPVVYVALNKANNKLYVGVTKYILSRRCREHFRGAKNGATGLFARAIRKYGEGQFDFFIFAAYDSYERALLGERELIADIMPEYNLTVGGEGNLGWNPSEETRKRISDSRIGKPGVWASGIPQELREKMIAGQRAMSDPGAALRGRKRPPEVVEKIATKRRGKSLPSSTPELRALRVNNLLLASQRRSISIMCVDDGKTFATIKAASLHYGINKSYLQRVIKGESKSGVARGKRFEIVKP